ncbi:MAG: hypothetical protein AAGA03_03195, partial [Planctomycetota bacterium]
MVRFGFRLPFLILLAGGIFASLGCSRTKYRIEADREVYAAIAERNGDARWHTADYSIDADPRSRYFDPYHPDRSPLPPDDPASHRYMHCVDGKKGWSHWHDNGERLEIENPSWAEELPQYAEQTDNGELKLDVESSLRLAYIHSPQHQSQLETLYLSSLDVTAERFRLGSQYFGGYDIAYQHRGKLVPAGLEFDSTSGRYVITQPSTRAEINRVTVGTTGTENPT